MVTGSGVVGHRLHCSAVHGIFPDQGWNLVSGVGRQIFTTATREDPTHPFRHRLIPNDIESGKYSKPFFLFPLVNTVYVK